GMLFDKAQKFKIRKGFPFSEPSHLAGIRSLRPNGPRRYEKRLSDKVLLDRITAAWTGRCVGCLLGRFPIEGARSWELKGFLTATGQWPLADYIRFKSSPKVKKQFPKFANNDAFDTIDHMPVDDDT